MFTFAVYMNEYVATFFLSFKRCGIEYKNARNIGNHIFALNFFASSQNSHN